MMWLRWRQSQCPPVPASNLTLGETYEQYDRSDAGVVGPNAGGLWDKP
jgi:hypothetical protein